MPSLPSTLPPVEQSRGFASVLAGVGGFVDASGFLVLFGLFTAHMSGNSTGLGVALGTGDWPTALERGFVIPVFVAATAAGVAWIESRTRRARTAVARDRAIASVLGAEVVALAVFMVTGATLGRRPEFAIDTAAFFVVGTAAAAAMGLQNAALRRVNVESVHTTFVTGMLTEAAVGLVSWWHEARDHVEDDHAGRVARARRKALFDIQVWATYLAGGCLGAFLVYHFDLWMVVVPIVVLLIVIGLHVGAPSPADAADTDA